MRALIHEEAGSVGAGATDIAGRPLLIRQLQWLRELGIEDVVVEVAIGPAASERARMLLGSDPLSTRCVVIPTKCAVGVTVLATRAGLAVDEPFLALPADTLVQGALVFSDALASYELPAPSFAPPQPTVSIALRTRAQTSAALPAEPGCWALRVTEPGIAHAVSCAALTGLASGVLVHAAEQRPGIWLARGARVADDANLLPPVLVGADARVFGGARVGPNVVLGAHSVIDRDVALSDVTVNAGTWVGEGVRVRQAVLDARGVTSFVDQQRTGVDEPLQLTDTLERGPRIGARVVALLLGSLLLLPWTLAFSATALFGKRIVRKVPFRGVELHVGKMGVALLDLVPPLFDVLVGTRDLVGVAYPRALEVEGTRSDGPRRPGALDVSSALAPGSSTSTVLWMWRWYLKNKGAALDRQLFVQQRMRRLRQALGRKKHPT